MSDRPHDIVEAAQCLAYGAEHFRKLESWLHHLHGYGTKGHEPYTDMLPAVKKLFTALEDFAAHAEKAACSLSGEQPEREDTLCGFVFLGGVDADRDRQKWMQRVIRRLKNSGS